MKALGIDIGSLNTKAVILGNDGIQASSIIASGDEADPRPHAAIQVRFTLWRESRFVVPLGGACVCRLCRRILVGRLAGNNAAVASPL